MKYFTLAELTRTSTPFANKITPEATQKITALVENVLDPLRELYGKPIKVNSGFRSVLVNRYVGGKPTSQHTKGEAVDITGGSKIENKKLYELIKDNLPFDQLIIEQDYTWIHVSFRKGNNRKQILSL